MVNESVLFLLFVFVVSYVNFYILHSNGRKVFSISHALAITWLVGYCLKIEFVEKACSNLNKD